MSTGDDIRAFAYVDSPYTRARRILTTDALAAVHAASESAMSRTKSIAASLGVPLSGVEAKKQTPIAVREMKDRPEGDTVAEGTRFHLEWKPTEGPGLFPLATAELSIHPHSELATRLELAGKCQPSVAWLGTAVNASVSHRIAEASIHRFLSEVASYLSGELAHESPG